MQIIPMHIGFCKMVIGVEQLGEGLVCDREGSGNLSDGLFETILYAKAGGFCYPLGKGVPDCETEHRECYR